MSKKNDMLDAMTIGGYLMSMMNLKLNQEQITNQDIDKHLNEQDNLINNHLITLLELTIEQNAEIIKLLKGG